MKRALLLIVLGSLLFPLDAFAVTASETELMKNEKDYWDAKATLEEAKTRLDKDRWNGLQAAPATGKLEIDDKFNYHGIVISEPCLYQLFSGIAIGVKQRFSKKAQGGSRAATPFVIVVDSIERVRAALTEFNKAVRTRNEIQRHIALLSPRYGVIAGVPTNEAESRFGLSGETALVFAQAVSAIFLKDQKITSAAHELDPGWFNRCLVAFDSEFGQLQDRTADEASITKLRNTLAAQSRILEDVENKIVAELEANTISERSHQNDCDVLGIEADVQTKRVEMTKSVKELERLEKTAKDRLTAQHALEITQMKTKKLATEKALVASLSAQVANLAADIDDHQDHFRAGSLAADYLGQNGIVVEVRKPLAGSYTRTRKAFLSNPDVSYFGGVVANFTVFKGTKLEVVADGFNAVKTGFRHTSDRDYGFTIYPPNAP